MTQLTQLYSMGMNPGVVLELLKNAPALSRQETDKEVWVLSDGNMCNQHPGGITAVVGRHAALDACRTRLGVDRLGHRMEHTIVRAYGLFVEGAPWPVGEEIRFFADKNLTLTRIARL